MIQKATEMGVASLRPVMTTRTIASRVNTDRMRANVIEAAEQCGVLRVPEVLEPCKLEACWRAGPAGPLIFADEAAPAASPLAAFEGLQRGASLAVIIGPEGGFSDAERVCCTVSRRTVPCHSGQELCAQIQPPSHSSPWLMPCSGTGIGSEIARVLAGAARPAIKSWPRHVTGAPIDGIARWTGWIWSGRSKASA